jgi:hypothetical protein
MSMVAYQAPYLLQVMYDTDPLNPREDYDNFGHMVCWHSRYNLGDQHDYEDTSELFQRLVLDSVAADTVIDYVKSGKAEGIRLMQNADTSQWEIQSMSSYYKDWRSDYIFDNSFESSKQEIFEGLVESLSNKDLYTLASEKNIILPLNLYDHGGISISVTSFLGRAQHAEWDSGQVGWIFATPQEIQKEYGALAKESYEKAEDLLRSEVESYNYYLTGQCYGFRLYENGEETDNCWGFLGSFSEVIKSIAGESLPESHRAMIDNFHEVSDTVTREKGYDDLMEDLEEMEA